MCGVWVYVCVYALEEMAPSVCIASLLDCCASSKLVFWDCFIFEHTPTHAYLWRHSHTKLCRYTAEWHILVSTVKADVYFRTGSSLVFELFFNFRFTSRRVAISLTDSLLLSCILYAYVCVSARFCPVMSACACVKWPSVRLQGSERHKAETGAKG